MYSFITICLLNLSTHLSSLRHLIHQISRFNPSHYKNHWKHREIRRAVEGGGGEESKRECGNVGMEACETLQGGFVL